MPGCSVPGHGGQIIRVNECRFDAEWVSIHQQLDGGAICRGRKDAPVEAAMLQRDHAGGAASERSPAPISSAWLVGLA